MSDGPFSDGKTITLDGRKLVGWRNFHDTFAGAFSFPDFYGHNMDAWIDCMNSLDDPDDGMSSVHVQKKGKQSLFTLRTTSILGRLEKINGLL